MTLTEAKKDRQVPVFFASEFASESLCMWLRLMGRILMQEFL